MRKTFAEIDAERKRYDPRHEGYGSSRQWRGDFNERMGFEEAQRIVDEVYETPRTILGVNLLAGWEMIVKAYRHMAMATHPDRAKLNNMTVEAATAAFKRVAAAYTVLCHEFGK